MKRDDRELHNIKLLIKQLMDDVVTLKRENVELKNRLIKLEISKNVLGPSRILHKI